MPSSNSSRRTATRAASTGLRALFFVVGACGPTPIHVVGVMRRSAEMRPLPSVPLGGYQKLHLLVRASSDQQGERGDSPDCGYATVEGTDEAQDRRNAVCVPTETLNTVIGIVRQRLRAYGITVARDASEPHEYTVEVSVKGEAPRQPDRSLARAVARVAFKQHSDSPNALGEGADRSAAVAAFAAISKDCGLPSATPEEFSASSSQSMTPEFDVVALSSDAVDNLLRCYDLANFFLEAGNRRP